MLWQLTAIEQSSTTSTYTKDRIRAAFLKHIHHLHRAAPTATHSSHLSLIAFTVRRPRMSSKRADPKRAQTHPAHRFSLYITHCKQPPASVAGVLPNIRPFGAIAPH